MLDELFFVWSAIWQEEVTAFAVFLAGYGFWKGFFALLIGSSIGMTLLFYCPEMLLWLGEQTIVLTKRVLRQNGANGRSQQMERRLFAINAGLQRFRDMLTSYIVNSRYPSAVIFFLVAIPLLPYAVTVSIITARLLKLPRAFLLIFTGNMVGVLTSAIASYRLFVLF
ncbi:MAG: hypothetical protein WC693_01150 [Patescibacteria group bacterium]